MSVATPAEERLRAVPWRALAPIAAELDAPIAEVLSGAAAERVLRAFLRARPALPAEARAAAAEAVFGVGLWRRRLRAQLGDPDASPRVLLAALARDLGGIQEGAAALAGIAPDALPPSRPPPAALADRYSLPGWLASEIERAAGPDAAALADALSRPGPVCLRANLARISREALAAALAAEGVATRAGRLAPGALVVEGARPNVLGLAAIREGLCEVQDEGSQLLGELVGARPGEAILDACAGAGGKTLLLAAAAAPGGTVHATDPDRERLVRLRGRARRAGGARVLLHAGPAPAELRVDRVLVDAPCSELGALRRGPDLRWRIDPGGFAALPALQAGILSDAARHVRPGGRLVYATCTFRREEDEDVARAFEAGHTAFARVLPEVAPALTTAEGFLRTWPHRDGTDAFFAAVWQRRPGT